MLGYHASIRMWSNIKFQIMASWEGLVQYNAVIEMLVVSRVGVPISIY